MTPRTVGCVICASCGRRMGAYKGRLSGNLYANRHGKHYPRLHYLAE